MTSQGCAPGQSQFGASPQSPPPASESDGRPQCVALHGQVRPSSITAQHRISIPRSASPLPLSMRRWKFEGNSRQGTKVLPAQTPASSQAEGAPGSGSFSGAGWYLLLSEFWLPGSGSSVSHWVSFNNNSSPSDRGGKTSQSRRQREPLNVLVLDACHDLQKVTGEPFQRARWGSGLSGRRGRSSQHCAHRPARARGLLPADPLWLRISTLMIYVSLQIICAC